MIDRAEIKADAKEKISGKIGALFIIGIIYAIVMGVLTMTFGIGLLVLGGAFMLAVSAIFLRVAKGDEDPDVKDLFATMNSKDISRGFFANIRLAFFTWAWGLLFVIPGIIKSFAYSQTFYLLADNEDMTAVEAQAKSIEMMNGHKGEYFMLMLSFIGWEILANFTFGLLYVWLVPYMSTTFANFYLKLKEAE
jgi:uncharacterized membrane protein